MLRLHVAVGPSKIDKDLKYNVQYVYYLIAREEGTPQFLKRYKPKKFFNTEPSGLTADVFITDLKDLTPFPKAYIDAKLPEWTKKYTQINKKA